MSVGEVLVQTTSTDQLHHKSAVDIDAPKWDQSTFLGRLRHFAAVASPRKAFASHAELDEAKVLVTAYRYWFFE